MKNFRFSIITLGTVFLITGLCSFASAASGNRTAVAQSPAVATRRPPVMAADPCPQGWHKYASLDNGEYKCKPNKPAPQTCPPGLTWVDDSQTNCMVGCIYYVK
ncbi:MAG: hypothetical protein KKB30_15765 [Proteobacteria bacterium]|nr:hypothetical protein [Pseudomonadota bacterium]MBU1714479.1 hypothetical protein [Pseudomonadota bacterium]